MGTTCHIPESGSAFLTTHWSVVVSARDKDASTSATALEKLCCSYWFPLYAHARRLGYSPQDAEDLTQEFFYRLLQKNYLESADRRKGRFRTFLLVALKHFLANEWDRAQAQKRGGGYVAVLLDSVLAERLYAELSVPDSSPSQEFERQWALTLVRQALARLRNEYQQSGKLDEFEQLKGALTADRGGIDYTTLAAGLGTSDGAARVMVCRLRRRFRELFREEILQTLVNPDDLQDEIRYLMKMLAG